MTLTPIYTSKFKKDLKLCSKRGYNMELLKVVVDLLINNKILPEIYKDHVLVGNYKDLRECHILSNWLLIYRIENEYIYFTRTGTHSDLF